ncbi:MAG TPA: magnesium transporter, partial [Usitatibacteraceae bacterium]|nr:magnesium transporter [Usitatibacteraceae bacterium]
MPLSADNPRSATPQDHLDAVTKLLAKQRLVEDLVHRQVDEDARRHEVVESLVHKQNLAELQRRLDGLHPADVAFVLEGLPLEERLLVWGLVRSERDGEILLEVSDAVRDTLLADMDSAEIVAAAQTLDADEIADLAPDLPDEVVQDIIEAHDAHERAQLQSALSYPEGSVGALMDFEVVSIREDVTCEVALRYLRRFDELPGQTDALFVVDRDDHLKGILPLKRLLVSDPEVEVSALTERDVVSFTPDGDAEEAAQAFEKYDLVSAPVVSADGRVVARLTVDAVLDFVRESQESQELAKVGLREEEDLFSSVWLSAKNRGPWLALNLCTAFVASRVVGAFEGSIEKLAALAALMPIVAGIGGNSGNQTATLIVRALAFDQVSAANARRLLAKELGISALNGALWGSVLGFVAWLLYRNVALGGVMALAMMLN